MGRPADWPFTWPFSWPFSSPASWHSHPQRIRPRRLSRALLRRAATRYAAHGWDVLPGACLVGTRFDCEQPGCHTVACHPALPDWEVVAGHDIATVRSWWRDGHHAVLLATGRAFDVLEVPAELGSFAVSQVRGPVAVAPSGRWLFFVRPGGGLPPGLADRLDVVLHGPRSWVAAPPTRFPGGRMRWEVPPEAYDWRLPDPYAVQALLLTGVRTRTAATPSTAAVAPLRRAA